MVGVSNLRRLAADHAILFTELPPCYFFPPSSAESSVDDLTQLTILLTGPTGTPYSQGLWKLSLKIPESYPTAPPKATFRTRIWHPNVDENTGSVCVDTLKKDWQPNLTLRDVLTTIYCLLIQPNPDSALNATAGHLLQDDYDSFARQARLMTSIHGRIPHDLKDLALSARRRGEIAGTAVGEGIEQRPITEGKLGSAPTSFPSREPPDCVNHAQSAPSTLGQALKNQSPASEDEYSSSASKENDPLLSPSPVPVPSPRQPSTAKRPLSELHIMEPGYEMTSAPCLSPSEQDIANDVLPSEENSATNVLPPTQIAGSDSAQGGLQWMEKIQSICKTSHGQETRGGSTGSDVPEEKPTKRICSGSSKDNILEIWEARKPHETPLPATSAATEYELPASRKASSSNVSGPSRAKGKSRVGLRRL